jgi:hypothetical protein
MYGVNAGPQPQGALLTLTATGVFDRISAPGFRLVTREQGTPAVMPLSRGLHLELSAGGGAMRVRERRIGHRQPAAETNRLGARVQYIKPSMRDPTAFSAVAEALSRFYPSVRRLRIGDEARLPRSLRQAAQLRRCPLRPTLQRIVALYATNHEWAVRSAMTWLMPVFKLPAHAAGRTRLRIDVYDR